MLKIMCYKAFKLDTMLQPKKLYVAFTASY